MSDRIWAKTGRGAWTREGGLLPPKPGQTGRGYYYRPPYDGEAMVGSAGLAVGATYDDLVVTEAVRAIQRLAVTHAMRNRLAIPDLAITGKFGDRTGEVVAKVQKDLGLTVDCIVGPKTVWALIEPIFVEAAVRHRIPAWVLKGIAKVESQLDLGASGATTPADTGILQANREAHQAITLRQAVDPRWVADWTALAIADRLERYRKGGKGDPMLPAIASHNSPARAAEWAATGQPPNEKIATYVARVQEAGQA